MHLMALSATSKSCSSWWVVSVGDTAWLLLAVAREAPSGAGVSGRLLSPCSLPFLILASPLGLMPPSVGIHRYGEYEVGLYVPVPTGRRPEGYHHLRPLPHALGKLLWPILQHGCSGLPSEVRESDLMNGLFPRWPAPHSMEPETPKPVRSQWLSSSLNSLLVYYLQEDSVWQCIRHHLTHLRDGD